MSELIALKSMNQEMLSDVLESNFSNLKQQALLFDQIGIFNLGVLNKSIDEALYHLKNPDPNLFTLVESVFAELEWLKQNQIIFELKIEEELSNPQFIRANIGHQFDDTKKLLNRIWQIEEVDLESGKQETIKNELIEERNFALLRLMVIVMGVTKGVSAVTTFPYKKYASELPTSNKSNAAQIVIKKLPLPNNETPWEKIIDFRNDPENQKNLLSLRRWIRKISTEELSKGEIEEEIEWLINEFQTHMNYHKIKANTETLEVLVKAPLEIIEDLMKLKWSKIPEPFFALKKRQLLLMDAEINAPGKELAYIIKSRETFQPQE